MASGAASCGILIDLVFKKHFVLSYLILAAKSL
jgi:hypothetical protein